MKICQACHATFTGSDWSCPRCSFTPEFRDGIPFFATEQSVENSGFPSGSHEILAQLERGNFWFVNRNRLIAMALERYFPSAVTMCEIGCGTGVVLEHLAALRPDMNLTGGELYEAGLRVCKRRLPGVELIQVDALRLPYRGEFDLVGAFDVLEHIQDDVRVLANFHDMLAPGGGLLVTVPQHAWLWSHLDDYACHKRRYSRHELVTKVQAAGFRIIWASSFLSLLLPFMQAARLRFLLPMTNKTRIDPAAELRLPGGLNAMFGHVCAVERALMGIGITFPAGGSLICAAVRQ